MVQKLIITKTAERSFVAIATYLEEHFSEETAERFAQAVDKKVQLLRKNPFSGRPSGKAKTVRKIKNGMVTRNSF